MIVKVNVAPINHRSICEHVLRVCITFVLHFRLAWLTCLDIVHGRVTAPKSEAVINIDLFRDQKWIPKLIWEFNFCHRKRFLLRNKAHLSTSRRASSVQLNSPDSTLSKNLLLRLIKHRGTSTNRWIRNKNCPFLGKFFLCFWLIQEPVHTPGAAGSRSAAPGEW